MIRLLLGLALLPTAALTVYSAAHVLGALFAKAPSAWPFLAGACGASGLWLLSLCAESRGRAAGARVLRAVRWVYVFGHEFTHVLAAWAVGGKVHAMEVRSDGGHVDLSHSNAFISLAPYCVPIYTILVVLGYRAAQWLWPGRLGLGAFLALMGITLAGHLLMTGECLWQRRQPDLAAAGGLLFSLSVIALCNGLAVMLLTKALFPRAVELAGPLRQVAELSAAFWAGGWGLLADVLGPIRRGYRP